MVLRALLLEFGEGLFPSHAVIPRQNSSTFYPFLPELLKTYYFKKIIDQKKNQERSDCLSQRILEPSHSATVTT